MTYYIPQDYAERYYIQFVDIQGSEWKVSIQQPNYDGDSTALTGAAEPIEWAGKGDESQDEVVLGSTGTLRMICTDAQSSLFTKGNILPTAINDRRVQVMKKMSGDWVIYWQGFIVPETFTQDWDRPPYEIELPIVSVVAAMEYFPMPLPGENAYSTFESQTNIAGLLRAILAWSGCEIYNIVTNKPVYEDFNGNTQIIPVPGVDDSLTYAAHWTQGVVSFSYFYDNNDGILTPKTFKDVLETICYPYGKVQDYATDVAFLMRWKDDAGDSTELDSISVWDNYPNTAYATGVRFGYYSPLPKLNLQRVLTAGTDNKQSLLLAPRNIKFSSKIDSDNTIFELTEEYIQSALPIGTSLQGKPIQIVSEGLAGINRYVYAIPSSYINLECAEDWKFYEGDTEIQSNDHAFCRVVEVSSNSQDATFSVSKTIDLGLCFNVFAINTTEATTFFTLPVGVKTSWGANCVKITVRPYILNLKDPEIFRDNVLINGQMSFIIQDLYNGKFLVYNNQDQLTWIDPQTWAGYDSNRVTTWPKISGEKFNHTSSDFLFWLNEERQSTDLSTHKLRIGVDVVSTVTLPGYTYGRMYCSLKFEYVEYNFLVDNGSGQLTYPTQAVLSSFADGIKNNIEHNTSTGGNQELGIEFKTRAGNPNIVTDGIVTLPFNSFCDSTEYMDGQDRDMIEINAAQFERYTVTAGTFDLPTQYAVIKDGTKVYIPVAVGMNPRLSTVRLRLISTNVTSNT